jgi:predicted O-methyltransferase YrrM
MPQFTDYFAPRAQAWRDLLFGRFKWDPERPRTVVEIGSYEGSSAYWMLSELLRAPQSRLYCIDMWPDDWGQEHFVRFQENIAELPNGDQVEVVREWSQNGLRRLINQGVQADLLYIDGGHAAPTVLRDLVLGFELVRVGGLVICDDYLWADPQWGGDNVLRRPKIAIDAFTTIYGEKLEICGGLPNPQVFFRKIAD